MFGKVMICDIVLEFLETVLHSILYLRRIYCQGVFNKSTLYRVPVHICAHRGVRNYLSRTLHCLRPFIEAGQLESVSVLILDCNGQCVEEVRVQVSLRAASESSPKDLDDPWMIGLENQLSSALQRIYHLLSQTPLPPENSSFRVHMSVIGDSPPNPDPEFPCVSVGSVSHFSTVVPVHSIHYGAVDIQISDLKHTA